MAFADCIGYTDEFDARVLDGNLRPIEGADVWVKFDRGTLFGDQYFTTANRSSDSEGKVHYKILNQGTLTRTIDCQIVVRAAAGGMTNKTIVNANEHGPIVDVYLGNIYPVNFIVKDQLGAPVANASVTLGDKLVKTDDRGRTTFYYVAGEYDYLVSFQSAKQAGKLEITDTVDFEVIFTYYNIKIEVKDDYGEPLPATLAILNETFVIQDGYYELNKTYGERVEYEITYKGLTRSGEIVASVDPNVRIILDVHAPSIGEVQSETVNKRTKLNFEVNDPGGYASGVDVPSVKVRYRLEPADATTPWNSAVVFASGFSSFSAEFPELPANKVVQFRIEAMDKEGNKATKDGKFSTLQIDQDTTQNQTDTQETDGESQGIPLFVIIVGVIVTILALYLVFRMKSKGYGG